MSSENNIPVGTVCAMFGLNPNTVRTWERRYQFPSPVRSASGHRSYTSNDIERIGRIVKLINAGTPPVEAIREVMAGPADTAARAYRAANTFEEQALEALRSHDHPHLTQIISRAVTQAGYRRFIEDLAFPVLGRLGAAWENTGEGVAAEHAFSLLMEGVILEQLRTIPSPNGAPVVTFACVPGELHRLPLLHLCNLAKEQSVTRPLVLAAGLPIEEILMASRAGDAKLLVLSATITPQSTDTRDWLKQCMASGWENRIVLAGPGFSRSRVYAQYPVRAAVGGFQQTVELLSSILCKK
jgi:DNA-binding transcriptional MerR regulator